LNRAQDWAAKRLETLHGCLGVELSALDFSDDRLATGLDRLSDDKRRASFGAAWDNY
jgi:hypothetical protein